MSPQVFYRKWRPQRFSDVVGQEYVMQTLLNALSTGKVAHAYLFCGPRGTGKTSTARILAKALNCQRDGKGEPCNACSMCVGITEGRALDLIEIDAASNRGIDEMRSIREKVNFAPNEARYKVYIIDEAHMLTEPAFNALLRTLEEPPPRTIFILATTDVDKLPSTVISRCQRFDFRRITLKGVQEQLAKICADEGIVATPEVLSAVAKAAGGSLRDAENIFEQMVVGYGTDLNLDQVREFLGVGGARQVRELVAAVLAGDVRAGLQVIGTAGSDGLDLRQFHRQLMGYLRALLLLKAGAAEIVDDLVDSRPELETAARATTLDHILRAVKLFGQADLRNNNAYSTLPLELAFIEAATAAVTTTALPQARTVAASPPPAASRGPVSAPSSLPRPAAAAQDTSAPRAPVPDLSNGARTVPPVPSKPTLNGQQTTHPGDPGLDLLRANWGKVIEASKQPGQKVKIDALLRSAQPHSVDAEAVVLSFSHENFVDMMRKELDNPGSRKALEEALAGVLGARREVRCIVRAKEKKTSGHLLRAAIDIGAREIQEGEPQ